MNYSFQHQFDSLKKLLATSSLSPAEQEAFLQKIAAKGYIDDDLKADLIDILNQENQVIDEALQFLSPDNLKTLAEEGQKIAKLEEEVDEIEADIMIDKTNKTAL